MKLFLKRLRTAFVYAVNFFDFLMLGNPEIKSVQLCVSTLCNYKCSICWDKDFHNLNGRYIDRYAEKFFNTQEGIKNKRLNLSLKNLEQIIFNLKNRALKKINIIGHGEPFLNPEIFEIINFLKKEGYFLRAATNFSVFNEEKINKLVNTGIDELQISVNFFEDKNYKLNTAAEISLNEIIKNIKIMCEKAKNKNIKIYISSVLTKQNINGYIGFIENFSPFYDIVSFEIVPFAACEENKELELDCGNKDDLIKIVNFLNKNKISFSLSAGLLKTKRSGVLKDNGVPCFTVCNFFLIMPSGDITACCEGLYVFGNLIRQNIKKIWYSKEYFLLRYYALNNNFKKIMEIFNARCFICGFYYENKGIFENLKSYQKKYLKYRKAISKKIESITA